MYLRCRPTFFIMSWFNIDCSRHWYNEANLWMKWTDLMNISMRPQQTTDTVLLILQSLSFYPILLLYMYRFFNSMVCINMVLFILHLIIYRAEFSDPLHFRFIICQPTLLIYLINHRNKKLIVEVYSGSWIVHNSSSFTCIVRT